MSSASMSGRILRQARISQTLCRKATVGRPHIRYYSASAALKTSTYHDPDPVAGPSHAPMASGSAGSTPTVAAQETQSGHDIGGNVQESGQPTYTARSSEDSKRTKEPSSSSQARPKRKSLQPSKVETYLASINAAGVEPTLADLERCRPAHRSRHDSAAYPTEYNALVDTLSRSFTKEQLRKLLEQWDSNCVWCRPRRRKVQYAESIIEKMWGWPSLKDVERAKRDRTEVSVKTFPLSASQLFLILGRDGADLLEMSLAHNVHISLTKNPSALRVEGVRSSLKSLSEHIDSVKELIVEETFRLQTGTVIPPDMIQRISRLAEAFVENVDSTGTVRISAKNSKNVEIAKRLASQASHELRQIQHPSRLAYLPSDKSDLTMALFPQEYSLYPFLSPRSLPWTMNSASAFRVRRVGKFFGPDLGEDLRMTGGLAGGKGRIRTSTSEYADLRHVLLPDLSTTTQSTEKHTVKAAFGHVLITAKSPGQRATLVPPLKGSHSFVDILKWMDSGSVQSSFVPSLPARLMDSSPTQQKIMHRLIYHAIPPTTNQDVLNANPKERHARINKIMQFEILLAQSRPGGAETLPEGDSAEHTLDSAPERYEGDPFVDPTSGPRCWVGTESQVDLMMPNRPMDMRLSCLSSSFISSGEEPSELQAYIADLRAFLADPDRKQPDPPLMLHHGADNFLLHTSCSVRQSAELINVDGKIPQSELDAETPAIKVVSESILDLESNQKSTHCEITCDDHSSTEAWLRFLTDCDRLTSVTYPKQTITVEQLDNDNAN